MNNTSRYEVKLEAETEIEGEEEKIKFYFESVGSTNVVKAIEYSPLGITLEGKSVYNLGFGDYNIDSQKISDTSLSNNGDVYKVFNTVLNTVPVFFTKIPSGAIFVQGSDSDSSYFDNCIQDCKKRCVDKCKNAGRRISLYRNYVDKNYTSLNNDYIFKGGFIDKASNQAIIENYEIGKPYDVILVYKRN